MIDCDAELGHDFFEIPIRYRKPNIEIDRVQNHRFRVLCAFETDQLLIPDYGFRQRALDQAETRRNGNPKVCDTTGFKALDSAAATIAGIETAHMIRKGQFGANGLTAAQQFAALAA